jgi:hypothetical protein
LRRILAQLSGRLAPMGGAQFGEQRNEFGVGLPRTAAISAPRLLSRIAEVGKSEAREIRQCGLNP